MRSKHLVVFVGVLAFSVMMLGFSADSFAKERIIFGGGPAGGTFQVVANGIQVYKPVKAVEEFTVKAQTSAGSVENLRKTNAGKQHFSTVIRRTGSIGRSCRFRDQER